MLNSLSSLLDDPPISDSSIPQPTIQEQILLQQQDHQPTIQEQILQQQQQNHSPPQHIIHEQIPVSSQQDIINQQSVSQYLNSSPSEPMSPSHTGQSPQTPPKVSAEKPPDKATLLSMLQLLRQYNLKSTEEQLKKEIGLEADNEIGNLLTSYESEGDPNLYENAYQDLKKFIENSLDLYKFELGLVLYPVLVHMYIELVYNGHTRQAQDMLKNHVMDHEPHYREDLKKLSSVTRREQIRSNEIAETFMSTEYIIKMSRDTLALLKRFLQEKKHTVLLNIVQEHLYIDMHEGIARSKAHIASVTGGMIGESTRQDNKTKMFYGMPKEPDLQNTVQAIPDDEEDEATPDGDKPKKKKKRDLLFNKKAKSDPNAPHIERMPLVPLKDSEKMDKVRALREATKRVTLGPESLPSIACYTLFNTHHTVTCVEVSEDISILAVGFSESYIKLWSLVPQKLKAMKSADQLQDIEMESDDILVRIMDERNAETTRTLVGHEGAIRGISFSPDRSLLLSCSQDTTIRLWSLLLWRCLVVFKGHLHPVWDVKFSPHGYYFASVGHDRMARLWATDSHTPLRLFVGHHSDVDCVQFHPNSNYIATGSSDRTVRVWDCVLGTQVRLMTGHKAPIYVLVFSICGRFLASAGADANVMVWDMSSGNLVTLLSGHTDVIRTLTFSRDGNVLVSAGQDCNVKLWDFTKLSDEVGTEEINLNQSVDIKNHTSSSYLIRSYMTKASPLMHIVFSRRNILLTVATHDS